jgi:hypothetical protein
MRKMLMIKPVATMVAKKCDTDKLRRAPVVEDGMTYETYVDDMRLCYVNTRKLDGDELIMMMMLLFVCLHEQLLRSMRE